MNGDDLPVAAAWFSHLERDGSLVFGMKEFVPSQRAQAALDRMVLNGLISRAYGDDGSVEYRPAVDFSPLQKWLMDNLTDDTHSFPLVVKVGEGTGKAHIVPGEAFRELSKAVGRDTIQDILDFDVDDFAEVVDIAKREGLTAAQAIERMLDRRKPRSDRD